jgi:hypothetical protein
LTDLIEKVRGLGLAAGTENSLLSKLEGALAFLGVDNLAAVGKLEAFINECESQSGKELTTEQAEDLIAAAEAIIASFTTGVVQEWVARYDGPASENDSANAMAIDSAGNVYVTGSSIGNGSLGDWATMKYDTDGNLQWVARYNGPGNLGDGGNDVFVDDSGYVYVTGSSTGSESGTDLTTIKYSPDGDQLWIQRYDGPGSGNDSGYGVVVDSAGNVYVTGSSQGSKTAADWATIKYDSSGKQVGPVARFDGLELGLNDSPDYLAIHEASGKVVLYVTGGSQGIAGAGNDWATLKYETGY